MRESLTFLGLLLIVLLTAALAAPVFVDFNAHRAVIAGQLSQASGAQVRLDGPLQLRLLPKPQLTAANIEIAGAAGSIKAGEAHFALALMALLQGRLQFTEAGFDDAQIILDPAQLAQTRNPGDRVQFEQLQLRRAHLIVLREGSPAFELDDVTLAASAPSLDGPFQGAGDARAFGEKRMGDKTFGAISIGGTKFSFRFATEAFAKGALPLKALLKFSGASLDLDGRLSGGGDPVFDGQAKASALEEGWQAQAALTATLRGVAFSGLEARLGEGVLAPKLTGAGRFDGGADKLSMNLATPRIDAATLQKLATLVSVGGGLQADVTLAAEGLGWGGLDWSNLRLALQAQSDKAPQVQAQAEGPGGLQFTGSGVWDKGEWRGHGSVLSDDFPGFAAALRQSSPEAADQLASLPLRKLSGQGDFIVGGGHFGVTQAELRLDRSQVLGEFDYQVLAPGRRARLVARLSAPSLDLDAAPDLTGPALADLDLDLSLEARAVKLQRGGQNLIEAGRLAAHFLRDGESTRLEHLEISGLGGADLSASGQQKPGESFSGALRLKAPDLSELARLIARVAPGAPANFLAAHARELSPASLNVAKSADRFDLWGTLAATQMQARFAPEAQGRLSGAVTIVAPEASALLQQMGGSLPGPAALGPAQISAQASGDASGLTFTATGDLAKLHLLAEGNLADVLAQPSLTGDLTLAGDAAPVLARFDGVSVEATPARLSTRLEWNADALRLSRIAGTYDKVGFSGDLTRADGLISGALRLDSLSLAPLAALVLGPAEPAKAGALRSSLKFAPTLFDPPRAQIAILTPDLTIAPAIAGRGRFDLILDPNRLTISHLNMAVAGGEVQGGFDLRRNGLNVTLSGEAEGRGLLLQTPAFAAKLDGRLRWAGSGQSAAALAGSLAGEGAAQLRDLTVAAAASDAPDKVLAASEASDDPFDPQALARALNLDFAQGVASLGAASFTASLAGGRIVLTSENRQAPVFTLDLRDNSLDLALTVAAQKLPRHWNQPAPAAHVIWSGAFAAPERRIEAGPFINALAMRALEREQAQIDAQKFDLRERAFFRRRLESDRWQDQRRREIRDAIRADEARREAELVKKRLEQLKAVTGSALDLPPMLAPQNSSESGRY